MCLTDHCIIVNTGEHMVQQGADERVATVAFRWCICYSTHKPAFQVPLILKISCMIEALVLMPASSVLFGPCIVWDEGLP